MGRRYRGRRGRSAPDYKLEHKGGNEIKHIFAVRCEFRAVLRYPFKLDRREIYEHLIRTRYDEPVLQAIRVLEKSGMHDHFAKNDDFLLEHKGMQMTIDLPESTFAAQRQNYNEPMFKLVDLPPMMRSEIIEWVEGRRRVHTENNRFTNAVDNLFEHAGTWGQAIRIWPDLRNVVMEVGTARSFFEQMKAQSRLPALWNPADAEWDREFMNTILAELLLIGEPDGNEVKDVVRVTL